VNFHDVSTILGLVAIPFWYWAGYRHGRYGERPFYVAVWPWLRSRISPTKRGGASS
jgi:hypothetical protein